MKTWPVQEFSAAIFAAVDTVMEVLLNNRLIIAPNIMEKSTSCRWFQKYSRFLSKKIHEL